MTEGFFNPRCKATPLGELFFEMVVRTHCNEDTFAGHATCMQANRSLDPTPLSFFLSFSFFIFLY